jgi:hypothetical protein
MPTLREVPVVMYDISLNLLSGLTYCLFQNELGSRIDWGSDFYLLGLKSEKVSRRSYKCTVPKLKIQSGMVVQVKSSTNERRIPGGAEI